MHLEPDVVLLFVPDRWHKYRGFENDDEAFDLHDFIKAYCVQKGIATQFLEQHTLAHQQQCRVWWWLSLALYAKAMRTPWALDSLSSETAFVGLGFAINRHVSKGRHIVLGCSHLYNAQGQGLQYRLSRIENPTIINANPFMSRDDVLHRHYGHSDLGMLCGEILGLSKMDWNSADMYSRLPATVYSSKQIARLGMLLERFGPLSYDYRLFI